MTSSLHPVQCSDFPAHHGFFTRRGGVSEGIYAQLNCGPGSNDTADHVSANRAAVCAWFSQGSSVSLCTLYQVHSSNVVQVHAPWQVGSAPQADGMVTKMPGLALGILTADCGPVLFIDQEAGVIGAAHAGWKGAHAGILENTLDAMCLLGASRASIHAAIGPCIRAASYEVQQDFIGRFDHEPFATPCFHHDTVRNIYSFDLPRYITLRLQRYGIASIADVKLDTYADASLFYSYRRTTHEGAADYGRQISVIML